MRHGRALEATRLTVRVVRNLAVDELIIAGDCWDRGPRGDRVVDYLQRQPSMSFIWGNHDAAWLGACLGQEALIAHVVRISCRYRRLSQLEEGYGIIMQPLEHLAARSTPTIRRRASRPGRRACATRLHDGPDAEGGGGDAVQAGRPD